MELKLDLDGLNLEDNDIECLCSVGLFIMTKLLRLDLDLKNNLIGNGIGS